MMNSTAANTCSAPRWLHRWAVGTLALLFVLLALGAVVTSFQVGMADPVWPTRPWHLFTIDWQEPSPGFLIEHVHRLAGFLFGGVVSILAIALWVREPRLAVRWAGIALFVALLVAFGQLHGTLIKQQRLFREEAVVPVIDWFTVAMPTVAAACGLLAIAVLAMAKRVPGAWFRTGGVVLLLLVMVQGMLGGARVYLNDLLGTDLAVIHGSWAQVVTAVLVAIVIGTSAPSRAEQVNDGLCRLATAVAVLTFAQVVFGAVLRHLASPIGARLHLLGAFVVVAAILLLARQLKSPALPRSARVLRIVLHSLVGLQIFLGIEAWMMRFGGGLAAAAWRPVTIADALTRTAHALSGYGLFAAAVALACVLRRTRTVTFRPELLPIHSAELETVV